MRVKLLARLENAAEQRLNLLHAPAGYGKTSVLAQAFARFTELGCHAGWISLDQSDRDLTQFLSCLVEATHRSGIVLGNALTVTLSLLHGGARIPSETLKTLLLEDLLGLTQDLHLFLDDYHLVEAPDIQETVNAILLLPFSRVHLLIASRSSSTLPISRLRALGQLQELDSTDLAFSEIEVSDFVSKVFETPLNESQITRLRQRTEGWAASLQMIGIALHKTTDIDQFLDRFSGDRRDISGFLADEVIRRLPEELQTFLMVTAVLPRFSADLCNAIAGRTDARQMLDEIARRNLFMFSLDDTQTWYRYHHLFADFLQRRLTGHAAIDVGMLHRRASLWLAGHRMMTDAIEHAFLAGDVELAGKLLDQACEELFATGRISTLMAFSAQLPGHLLDRLPRLQLDRAWHAEMSWKFGEARDALVRVECVLKQLRAESADSKSCDLIRLEAKLDHRKMMLALLEDDLPEAYSRAQAWLESDATGDPFMRASAGSAVLCAGRELYRCEGVGARSHVLQRQYLEGGALYGIVFHECSAGGTFAARGDLRFALEAYGRGMQMAVKLQGEQSLLYNVPA
ncbi:MAG: hypothetical protein ACREUE_03450, partial [Panacagrimonas sp.]